MEITPAQLEQHNKLVKTARTWVAQAFFGEMLKQMHNSPFKSDMLEGGRGGQVFQGQLDQKLAERMAGSRSADRLVSAMVRKIEHRSRKDALPVRGKLTSGGASANASKGSLLDVVSAGSTGAATGVN
jgi:Rod binding domain-containing protein